VDRIDGEEAAIYIACKLRVDEYDCRGIAETAEQQAMNNSRAMVGLLTLLHEKGVITGDDVVTLCDSVAYGRYGI